MHRCIATLQGNQLRSLASRSLSALLALFKARPGSSSLDPFGDQLLWSCPPLLQLAVAAGGDGERGWLLQAMCQGWGRGWARTVCMLGRHPACEHHTAELLLALAALHSQCPRCPLHLTTHSCAQAA